MSPTSPDPVESAIRNVTIGGHVGAVDVTWSDGVITAIAPTADPAGGARGSFIFAGFADTHIHLDKAHLLDRTMGGGGLQEAIGKVRAAKRAFTVDDVRARAGRVLDSAIVHGTTLMRSFVEIDPDAGLRSFEALADLRSSQADRLELRLSAFAQDGTTRAPETLRLLARALDAGADEISGCPYTDDDPRRHVRAILDLAQEHEVPADFHVDFDLDPSWEHLSLILDEVQRRGLEGQVTIGHATKLAAFDDDRRADVARRLVDLDVRLTVLPATDLYLVGRTAPPGIATALATNNVCNPFTPYGNGDLLRMANLYATVNRLSSDEEIEGVWSMVADGADALLRTRRSLEVGAPATFVLMDATDPVTAVRELRQPLAGWKAGRPTFTRPIPELH